MLVDLAICLSDRGYVDLVRNRVYRRLRDPKAAKIGQVRVIDGSGEDYLYPRADFHLVRLPAEMAKRLLRMKT